MLTYKEHFANQIMTRRAEEFAALKVTRPATVPSIACLTSQMSISGILIIIHTGWWVVVDKKRWGMMQRQGEARIAEKRAVMG
jgi:hypothetical protein